ncbi:MAG: hypothetical protein CVV49_16935 [Spirochaetae bacterium HGW-Spirochaetae-5]|nr:MAG: hypothetical protein CVV49_16935 [Spirochaetae bacterium HGW-Spirochaetae-5]
MNSKFKNITVLSVMLFFSLLFISCEKAEEDDSAYSFEVISSYGNVVGYYKVDSGASQVFSGAAMGDSTVFYSFNKNLNLPESVLISATGVSDGAGVSSTTSVSIYIYEDSKLVKSATVSQISAGVPVTTSLYYTFGSEE